VAAYDGTSRPFGGATGPSCLALATSGTTVACGTNPISLVGLDGSTQKTTAGGFAQGWIDNERFLYASVPGGPSAPKLSVYDVRSGSAQPTGASGTFVATLPGAL
jgi:hypothetical protein